MTGAWYIADALDMVLHCQGDQIQGEAVHTAAIGPFAVTCHTKAWSDAGGGYFVRISDELWFYLLGRQTEAALYVVDAKKAGLSEKMVSSFKTTWVETLKRLDASKSITAVFKFEMLKWRKLIAADMVQELPKQDL